MLYHPLPLSNCFNKKAFLIWFIGFFWKNPILNRDGRLEFGTQFKGFCCKKLVLNRDRRVEFETGLLRLEKVGFSHILLTWWWVVGLNFRDGLAKIYRTWLIFFQCYINTMLNESFQLWLLISVNKWFKTSDFLWWLNRFDCWLASRKKNTESSG